MNRPSTIGGINRLTDPEKREIYARLIPAELLERYQIPVGMVDAQGRQLLQINAPAGSTSTEMSLYHQYGFVDPVLYGHITDTLNGQLHILFYILNDPNQPRFNIDRMEDGQLTQHGTQGRNLAAEEAAMRAGLAPGQVRQGPHMFREAANAFEQFVVSLGHTMYFAEPLHYHNAVIFERYGFSYLRGRRRMEHIASGFAPGGELNTLLDGSTPFRQPEAARSIRLRSWAIHDGVLGEIFTDITMYKHINKHAGINTCPDCAW